MGNLIMPTYKERFDELMKDETEYCCYCGTERAARFQCCGEIHFEKFSEMSKEDQKEFMCYEEWEDE